MEQPRAPWVFISHSNSDIQAVRRIRNRFEERGAQPILFFLKQSMQDELLWRIIHREIEARRFFALCDSQAARGSRYVRRETDLVRALPGKRFITIDLGQTVAQQDILVDKLIRDMTIFLSYSRKDQDAVLVYADALEQAEFQVWRDAQIALGADIGSELRRAIDNVTATGGFFLHFLSPSARASEWVKAELFHFLQPMPPVAKVMRRQLVVVLLGGLQLDDLPFELQTRHVVDLERAAHLPVADSDVIYSYAASGNDHRLNAARLADLLAAVPTP